MTFLPLSPSYAARQAVDIVKIIEHLITDVTVCGGADHDTKTLPCHDLSAMPNCETDP